MKKEKGITLIALVITIIVLLILAGITISLITGNESAPNKAVQARTENEKGAAKDAATLLVMEKTQQYYEDKYLNRTSNTGTILEYLEDENVLGGQNGVTTGEYTVSITEDTEEEGAITVSKGNSVIVTGTVDVDGIITWDGAAKQTLFKDSNNNVIDLATLNKDTVKGYYGVTVTTINNVEYGLFYVDYAGKYGEKGTVYLRAKSVVGYTNINYPSNTADSLRIILELNPGYAEVYNTRGNNYPNEREAEHLCNPAVSLWSGIGNSFRQKYGNNNINYVIGGPSAEMFFDSYNATYNTSYMVRYFNDTNNNNHPGYKYSKDNGNTFRTSPQITLETGNSVIGGMYIQNNDTVWLASQLNSVNAVCDVMNGAVGGHTIFGSMGVQPLVSIKPGTDLTK